MTLQSALGNERSDEFARKGTELHVSDQSDVATMAVHQKLVRTAATVLGLHGRGAEPLQHAFPSYEDRRHCSRSLPRGSARRAKWWEAWQGQRAQEPCQESTSVLVEGAEKARPVLHASPRLLVFCFRPAHQQSLPRLMLQCSHYLERQPDLRFRRTLFRGRHPACSALLDWISCPRCLFHHVRRALPHGTHRDKSC